MQRIQNIVALIVVITLFGSAEESALSPAANTAIAKYTTELAKADAERDKRVEVAKTALLQSLQRELETQTKAGKLDIAIAIRTKIEAVKTGESTASQEKTPATDLLGVAISDSGIKIPKLAWQPLGKTGISSALTLAPFPKGTKPDDILTYIGAGDFKKPYLGLSFQRMAVDGSGNLNCQNQDNSDTYWLVYVKAAGKTTVETIVTGEANPKDNTNSSELYFDGKIIPSGSKVSISSTGHAVVLRQIHNASYFNAWIRFLPEQPLLVSP